MESRGGPSGAVTAVARAAITIALDVVLPVGAEDDSLGRARNRRTIHAKSMEMVKLLEFACLPGIPRVKGLQLTASKRAQGLFSRSDQRRLEGVDGGEEKGSGKDGRREIKACAKGGNGPNILDGQKRDMRIFRIGGSKEVEFALSTGSSTSREALFRGKGETKRLDATFVEGSEGSEDVVTGENHRIINRNDIGALDLVARSLERGEK
jgi:hypothetical protein